MYQKLGKKVGKKFNLMAIFTLLVIMLSTTVLAVDFVDLSKEHWAYEPIMEMANRGILNGYPDSTFLPDNSITRAEFAKVLVLALNLKSNGKEIEFQDVASDDWAYKYIQAAAQYLSAYRDDSNNLIYMPNGKAVREDIAVAIVIASGHEKDKYSLKTLDKFSDKEEISSDLRKYVAIAVENGLMSGHADGTFEPKGYLTRAQVSKLMKNIEDFQNKVVIKEEDDSSKDEKKYTSTKIEKEYFTDISFDSKTLKLDLGKDWDKYQYCVKNHEKNTYVPSQRYLQYQSSDSTLFGKDSETGKSRSPMYGYFGGGEKSTFKIMLKENPKKYTLIELNDPFYVSKFVKKAYTQNDEKYIEIVVNATNNLIKAEYKIENGNWVEDIDAISGKKASFVINVTKYDDDDSHKITVKLTDEYGNVGEKSDDFKIEKEYFTDISFDSKTLKLDLGKDWDKYQYCVKNHEKSTYVPSQRYLQYQSSDSTLFGKDSETGKSRSPMYGYFGGGEKSTFKIMLKENPKKYTLIELNDPFYVSKFVKKAYTQNDEKYIEIVVNSTNNLIKAEYKIENGNWVEDIDAISGKKASFVINVTKYDDDDSHKITVKLTDEYGNVGEKSDDFRIEKEYFTDISFDSKTLKLDLGKDWDKYQYCATSSQTIYVPSQRYLIYNGILTSEKDEETGYNVENVYWYISQRIKEETFKIMLKNDPETYITIKITNPFYVAEMVNMEERGFFGYYANNGEPYITEVVDATNKLSKVEYSIDNDDWRTDTTAINGNRSEIRVNVKKYKDGMGHDIKTRWTDEYGNIAGNTYYFKFD